MRKTTTEAAGPRHTGLNADQAQALFESLFDHVPKTDTRTPGQVRSDHQVARYLGGRP